MHRKNFETRVAEALDALPDWVRARLGNLDVRVEDSHPEGLLGLYEGPSLLERDAAGMAGPSRILLYRLAILEEAEEGVPLERVIRETLAHEIGHHFGMDEGEMEEFEKAWEKAYPMRPPPE